MPKLNIRRTQRRVGVPEERIFDPGPANTAIQDALVGLGGAVTSAAVDIAKVIEAKKNRDDQADINDALIEYAKRTGQIQNDILSDETLNSKEGIDKYVLDSNDAIESISGNLNLNDRVREAFKSGVSPDIISGIDSLSNAYQQRGNNKIVSNISEAENIARQSVLSNPTPENTQKNIARVSAMIDASIQNPLTRAGIYTNKGVDPAEFKEGVINSIRENMILGQIRQDVKLAQISLDNLKAIIPPETFKTLQADIRKQTKIQNDAAEAARTESVQNLTSETINQAPSGTLTLTQLHADPRWSEATPKEKKNLETIVNDADPFKTSDNITKAFFIRTIATAPLSLTIDDFNDAHGRKENGIGTNDYKIFVNDWRKRVKEIEKGAAENPLQDGYEKQAYRLIEFMREDTAFIEAGGFFAGQSPEDLQENDLRAAQAVNSLAQYIVANPGVNYVEEYIIPVLQPAQEEFVSSLYDRASLLAAERTGRVKAQTEALFPIPSDGAPISVEEDLEIRRQAADLLTEKGQATTRENINRVSAQIREGNTELKILDAGEAQRLFQAASGATNEEKAENARRTAIRLGFIIP